MEKIPFIVDFPILRRHKYILNKFIISYYYLGTKTIFYVFYSDTVGEPARHTHPKTSTFGSISGLGDGRQRTPETSICACFRVRGVVAAGDRQNSKTSIRAHFGVRGIVAGSSRDWEVVMAGRLRQSEP